jgi:hypothetical protein
LRRRAPGGHGGRPYRHISNFELRTSNFLSRFLRGRRRVEDDDVDAAVAGAVVG